MHSKTCNTITEADLLEIQKPAQYLGGELNSIIKSPEAVSTRIALAFPDTYEVGMSHVGIQILYDLINRDDRAWAERVYMPFPDMEALLRKKGASLSSLESKTPLKDFDVIGFSLQYELCGTNLLGMLDLAGIPFYAADRGADDPLIIGGGPYTYHPEAISPFFDAFFMGDAEEFTPELIELIDEHKKSGSSREELIERLSALEGIYNPRHFVPSYDANMHLSDIESRGPKSTITRRLLPTLKNAPFPKAPVVPNTNIVHNRLSVEVMRGCVRGCRFCQAGYLYRPQRERSPEEVLELVQSVLPHTGFEEVSLLSLSTADYCSIVPLLKAMMDRYGEGETLSVSFPSTRVDALTPEVLEQVQRVRRTNFTIAPEGGSQRLRDVINKGVSDDQIIETCTNVFNMGWSGIKLYFMIGLPTETDEDIEEIISLAARLKKIPGAKNKDITVSVSTHVPKPHTPFQWCEQITPEETVRKQRILADGLKRIKVNFRYHEHFSSFLEGIFCRAGRELAPVIERAYELGARLDAWQDHLKEEVWMQAFNDFGIDPYKYLRERDLEETLPWDHLSCGIPKTYFQKEYKRALRTRTTPDCLKTSCSVCGACDYDIRKNVLWPRDETARKLAISVDSTDAKSGFLAGAPCAKSAMVTPVQKIRMRFSKKDIFRLLGHLELSTIIHRTCRRAEIPVAYSLGFHPHPKISFASPLPLGIISDAEYLDIFLFETVDPSHVMRSVNTYLPQGIEILEAYHIELNEPSLTQSITGAHYRVTFLKKPEGLYAHTAHPTSEQVMDLSITRKKRAKKKRRRGPQIQVFQLGEYIKDLSILTDEIGFSIISLPGQPSPSPIEVVHAISGLHLSEVYIRKDQSIFITDTKCNNPSDAVAKSVPLEASCTVSHY